MQERTGFRRQPKERINCQEYREQLTKTGVDMQRAEEQMQLTLNLGLMPMLVGV